MVELEAPHLVMLARPAEVVALIEEAVAHVGLETNVAAGS